MIVLIIDNNPQDTAYIKELLLKNTQKKQLVLIADTFQQGMELLSSQSITIILFDLHTIESEEGKELDILLLSYPHIPVIVYTQLGDEEKGTEALYKGSADYLVKGAIRGSGLIKAIENAIADHLIQVKTELLSVYGRRNLDALKKVLLAGQKAGIFPHNTIICRKLEQNIKEIGFDQLFSLFLFQKQEDQLVLFAHNHIEMDGEMQPPVHAHEQSVMFQALRMKQSVQAGMLDKTLKKNKKEQVYINDKTLCIPLVRDQEVLGVLNLQDYTGPVYPPGLLIRFKMLVHALTHAIKNNFISMDIEELSLTDDLTGVYNRRYLLWELNREMKRVQRYRGTLSILYIDMDNFKTINDMYGYKTGDLILENVSHEFIKLTRATDFIGRYTSEKFVIILTETSKKGAHILNKRIVEIITKKEFDVGINKPVQVKVNICSAEYNPKLKNGREYIDYVQALVEKQETAKEQPEGTEESGQGEFLDNKESIGEVEPLQKDTPSRERTSEEIETGSQTQAQTVRIYFIEPLELISVVIDTLVKMGFESYQIDITDKLKLLKILDKHIRNVIFICISSQNTLSDWFAYINIIDRMKDFNIQVGAFVYSRIEPQDSIKFLERNIAVVKFSDIQSDTVSALKKILLYFEAKGQRKYVRVEASDDSMAFISLENERKVIKAKISIISEQFFTCYCAKNDLHHFVQDRRFDKVMLRLKGTVVYISTRVLTTKKDDPCYCVMQICSVIYKNKKATYTNSLKKETKDKLHRYIRYCLKENIKKKLNEVRD